MGTLRGSSAAVFMAVIVVLGGMLFLVVETMPEGPLQLELLTGLVLGSSALAVTAVLVVFHRLTRRLRTLATAIAMFRRSGFREPVRLAFADSRRDEIDGIAAAFQELSERIADQLQQLQEIDTHRRELLSNVSHDLRTPLASMQGYLETLLLRHGTLGPEEERNYLEVAVKHSERLGKLVGDLFQLTKFDAKEVKLQVEPFSLAELAQDVVQQFQLSAERRGLLLESVLREDTPAVLADIGMVERALENLIENAMRHTPANGIVRVHVEPAGNRAVVRVADTGYGIASNDLPMIFDRYYRGDRGEETDAGNVGLGLAIAQRIVALHGGTIAVDSIVGRGTTFCFDLPLASP